MSSVCSSGLSSTIERYGHVERVHPKATTKMVKGLKRVSCEEKLRDPGLLSL